MFDLMDKKVLTILFLFLFSCNLAGENKGISGRDYREDMRQFVQAISLYAKSDTPAFNIIPQNGQELVTRDGEADGTLEQDYLTAVDGCGREDMFYGYKRDNRKTPRSDSAYMLELCRLFHQNGAAVLSTDYCDDPDKMDESYSLNHDEGFISFAAPERNLNVIPDYPDPVYQENTDSVRMLRDARNFLYLINSECYSTKSEFLKAVAETNYDLVIMDLFHNEEAYTRQELDRIRYKKNGGERLLICYMSIGEAEDYRFYWDSSWEKDPPPWLKEENPHWEGNYKVRYWDTEWQNIIFGSPSSYLDRIMAAGFDGVYLDIIDGYEYFE